MLNQELIDLMGTQANAMMIEKHVSNLLVAT